MASTRGLTVAARRKTGERSKRVRPSGRTALQQEQKQDTRNRLLSAAATAFAERSYAATSVEDIIRLAAVGRTSFYRHFDSKWSIASALCERVMPEVWSLWHELAALGDPSALEIAHWLARRVKLYHEHSAMFAVMKEAVAIEPEAMAAVSRTHDEVIHVLAAGIPAFDLAHGKSPISGEVKIRACLLLMQLDEFNYFLAVRGWDVDHKLATRLMAEQIRTFIDDVEGMRADADARKRSAVKPGKTPASTAARARRLP